MSLHEVLFNDLSFAYDTAPTPIFSGLELHFPPGWTGIVGANGAGKTTLLRLGSGQLRPDQGTVAAPDRALYCAQRTDTPPPLLPDLLEADDGEALALRDRLRMGADWLARWDTLSHGERKRAQIGAALWWAPDMLAIDEPTNHIDRQARALLVAALRQYHGVGLLVSHDRELLDELCGQCVFAEPPAATMRVGGYTSGAEQARLEEDSAREERDRATRDVLRLRAEATRRNREAARSDQRRSKRGLGKDNDARFKRNRARVSGKDGVAGRLLSQMDGRLRQAESRRDAISVKKTHELGVWLPGARSRRDSVLSCDSGDLPLGNGRALRYPDLTIRPDERVAVTGLNGTGKSTLIRSLVGRTNVPEPRLVYLPQEIDAQRSVSHDLPFLQRLTQTRWLLEESAAGADVLLRLAVGWNPSTSPSC